MAWSESKLEAGMVEQEVRQDLIDKYVAENGFVPVGEDMRRIEEAAYSSGLTTAMANFPLIYGTNAITFGTLFKGYKPLREAVDVGVDRLVRHEADIAGRRILTSDAPGALKQFGELFTKPSLRKTFGYLGRYTSANFSEVYKRSVRKLLQVQQKITMRIILIRHLMPRQERGLIV